MRSTVRLAVSHVRHPAHYDWIDVMVLRGAISLPLAILVSSSTVSSEPQFLRIFPRMFRMAISMGFSRHGRCLEMSGRAAAPRWHAQKGVVAYEFPRRGTLVVDLRTEL
jgi:hypothetical protein